MIKEYYCLVAGLPDLLFDAAKLSSSLIEFRNYLKEYLSPADYKLIQTYFLRYDNQNLLTFLQQGEPKLNQAGNLTREDFEEILAVYKENPEQLNKLPHPSYIIEFITAFKSEQPIIPGKSWDVQLSEIYYRYLFSVNNEFFKKWYTYEADLINILTAYNCRKYNYTIEHQLIGKNELTEKLVKSSARDFGIDNEFPAFDQLFRILDDNDLLEKEKKIDLLKWDILDDWSFFHYFSIEKIFSYLLKFEMVDRWTKLDKQTGETIFKKLLKDLETSHEFPEEFSQKK